jgi:hypothetical protein
MTELQAYEALKFWLPITSGFTFVYGAYRSLKKSIGAWADMLLNNHLHSIEINTKQSAALLTEVRDDGRKVAENVAQVASDLKVHEGKDDEVQHSILSTLEVLKDRS